MVINPFRFMQHYYALSEINISNILHSSLAKPQMILHLDVRCRRVSSIRHHLANTLHIGRGLLS